MTPHPEILNANVDITPGTSNSSTQVLAAPGLGLRYRLFYVSVGYASPTNWAALIRTRVGDGTIANRLAIINISPEAPSVYTSFFTQGVPCTPNTPISVAHIASAGGTTINYIVGYIIERP